jgi:sulfur-carrier protein adenylyltransferase/sulfurtransferase
LKFWWLLESARLAAEIAAVEALAGNEGWFDLERWRFHEKMFCAEGVLTAHGHRYPVRLIYPDQYPEVPAWVEPQDEARWSAHQYGTGTLCLELRPDNWNAAATGADLLRSAYNLLSIENPLGGGEARAPSAHDIGELQAYGWWEFPVLIGAACLARIRDGAAVGLNAVRWFAHDDLWPIMIHDEADRSLMQRPPDADFYSWRTAIPVYVSENPPPAPGALDRAGLVRAAAFDFMAAAIVEASTAAVVMFRAGEQVEIFHLTEDGGTFRRHVFVLPDEVGARSARAEGAMSKRVTIVGTGSVGSKIAETLLRSGVHHLTLVDGDVMLPGNLERHVLDWRDVGFRKVHGLRRHLLHIVPGADIQVIDSNLNWQRSAKTHAWQVEVLSGGDVILDATGDPATSLFLAAVAEANGRAFVSVEVFEGGIGAAIATCVAPRDPPFVEGRATFLAWCDAQGVKPPEAGTRRYEMLNAGGEPIVADDAAVTMTAGHGARTILDILDGSPPSSNSAWLLLGYRKEWLFDGHGHTIRLNVGERGERTAPEEVPEAISFAVSLYKERANEGGAGG